MWRKITMETYIYDNVYSAVSRTGAIYLWHN